MSHFAKLDENNAVIQVVVGNPDLSDAAALLEIESLLGGTWLQTSYNSKIRGNYAGIGYTYFADLDIFMPPKCHDEAILDVETAKWDCQNEGHHVPN